MILDVGCGSRPKGDVNIDLYIQPTHRGDETTAPDPKSIKNFILADSNFLPFRDESFSIVYSSHLLEHCIQPYKVLQEFKRVSKAIVYIEVPYGPRNPNDCPFHLYSWDSNSLRHLLLKVFPHVTVYSTERVAYNLRQHRVPLNILGDFLLLLIRKLRHFILWREQLTAVCYKFPVKFVYTLSDSGKLVSQAIKSIKSLRKFVDRENIIVFYTPPRSKRNLRKLSKLAVVKEVENISKPFVFDKSRGYGRYGEKIHVCSVDCPNVIFLDTDTIVTKNPIGLLEGDYAFSARPGDANRDFDQNVWRNMFRKIGKEPIPMPNTGFMIFKHHCHKKIREDWLTAVNNPLPNPHPVNNLKEQYALALAVSGEKIKWMTAREHAFGWEGEGKIDTYVFHYGKKRSLSKIKLQLKRIPFIRKILSSAVRMTSPRLKKLFTLLF